MGDVGSGLFIVAVVALWVYAGYRVVSGSQRRYATLRYVSPLLVLGLALIVLALVQSGETATFILAWTVPCLLVLLTAALLIDRARDNTTEG